MFDISFDYLDAEGVCEDLLLQIAKLITANELAGSDVELGVVLCSNAQMRAFNRSYRGVDKPTDVLSFVHQTGIRKEEIGVVADIIIDTNQVTKQKGTNTFEAELSKVFIHAMLHICGYDHIKKTDKEKMEDRERYYQNRLRGDDDSGRQ